MFVQRALPSYFPFGTFMLSPRPDPPRMSSCAQVNQIEQSIPKYIPQCYRSRACEFCTHGRDSTASFPPPWSGTKARPACGWSPCPRSATGTIVLSSSNPVVHAYQITRTWWKNRGKKTRKGGEGKGTHVNYCCQIWCHFRNSYQHNCRVSLIISHNIYFDRQKRYAGHNNAAIFDACITRYNIAGFDLAFQHTPTEQQTPANRNVEWLHFNTRKTSRSVAQR